MWTHNPSSPPGSLVHTDQPVWKDWERKQREEYEYGDVSIRFVYIGPTVVDIPVGGDDPTEWKPSDPPGSKLLPDGRDFVLWERQFPSVRWETWLILTVRIEWYIAASIWRPHRPFFSDWLLDVQEIQFGRQVTPSGDYHPTRNVTEWRWVESSMHGKTLAGHVGVELSGGHTIHIGGSGAVDLGGDDYSTTVPVKPKGDKTPKKEGLEYHPREELRPDNQERVPPGSDMLVEFSVVSDKGLNTIEVLANGRLLGRVGPDSPLRVSTSVLSSAKPRSWPPWGADGAVPFEPPGHLDREFIRMGLDPETLKKSRIIRQLPLDIGGGKSGRGRRTRPPAPSER